MAYKTNELGQVVMSFDEYMAIVNKCEAVDANTSDTEILEQKYKFSRRARFPSVQELMDHKVEDMFGVFLPYLVYYLEVYESNEPEFKDTRKWIQKLMNEKLVIT